MDITSSTYVPPPQRPASIELTLALTLDEAKLLRAVWGNQTQQMGEALRDALKSVCYFPPEYPDAHIAGNLLYAAAVELEAALTLADEPAIIAQRVM